MLDFHGNPLSDDELERQKGKIKKGTFVVGLWLVNVRILLRRT